MLNRPGFKTSEFYVSLLAVIAAIISAWQDYLSDPTSAKLGFGAAIAFVVSRGLAKYETRGPGSPPVG